MLVGPMLVYEAHETLHWHGIEEPQLHLLSSDAFKCFDRITFATASKAGQKCGLPKRLGFLIVWFRVGTKLFLLICAMRRFFWMTGTCGVTPKKDLIRVGDLALSGKERIAGSYHRHQLDYTHLSIFFKLITRRLHLHLHLSILLN